MKVLIAGAGLGGLCLAHGLRRAGIDVQVLERRPSPADQPASYGIHLDRFGLGALRACLPAANWKQLLGSSVPALDRVRFSGPQLKPLAVLDHETPGADQELHRRAVSRGALRDTLLAGLNTRTRGPGDVVQWAGPWPDTTATPAAACGSAALTATMWPRTCSSGPTEATHGSAPSACPVLTGKSSGSSTSPGASH